MAAGPKQGHHSKLADRRVTALVKDAHRNIQQLILHAVLLTAGGTLYCLRCGTAADAPSPSHAPQTPCAPRSCAAEQAERRPRQLRPRHADAEARPVNVSRQQLKPVFLCLVRRAPCTAFLQSASSWVLQAALLHCAAATSTLPVQLHAAHLRVLHLSHQLGLLLAIVGGQPTATPAIALVGDVDLQRQKRNMMCPDLYC